VIVSFLPLPALQIRKTQFSQKKLAAGPPGLDVFPQQMYTEIECMSFGPIQFAGAQKRRSSFLGQSRSIVFDACSPLSSNGIDKITRLFIIFIYHIFLRFVHYPPVHIQLHHGMSFLLEMSDGPIETHPLH
jgi:hypothetical protein